MVEELKVLLKEAGWVLLITLMIWVPLTLAMLFTAPLSVALAMFFWLDVAQVSLCAWYALLFWTELHPKSEVSKMVNKLRYNLTD